MSSITCALLLSLSFLTSTPPSHDYADAYRVAMADSNRPLVVLVGADWCPACREMKQTVLPQLEEQGGLSKVAFATVNVDADSKLAHELMEGGSMPQLVMFVKTDSGWERTQLTGGQSVSSVETFIAQGVDRPFAKTASR